MPLRSVDITEGNSGVAVLRFFMQFLQAQQTPYLPTHIRLVRLSAGLTELSFEFAAPSPLGLLGG
jgi:hypothetical protein